MKWLKKVAATPLTTIAKVIDSLAEIQNERTNAPSIHATRAGINAVSAALDDAQAQINEEINDVKTAVSEAVTNSIVHGYPDKTGEIVLEAEILDGTLHINVFDNGVGIENLNDALEPFFTTKSSEERSGIGFSVMQSFMDEVKVNSKIGIGTSVYMKKKLKIGS